jgi:hypothetical protein
MDYLVLYGKGTMNDKFERMWKETVMVCFKVLF